MGKIKIEKFISAEERKWQNDHPLLALTQKCHICKVINHDKYKCRHRNNHIGDEINRLKQLGLKENTQQFKQELKKCIFINVINIVKIFFINSCLCSVKYYKQETFIHFFLMINNFKSYKMVFFHHYKYQYMRQKLIFLSFSFL